MFVLLGQDVAGVAEGCLTGIVGLVIVIAISGFCFKIHPILGTIVLIIGLRALGKMKE